MLKVKLNTYNTYKRGKKEKIPKTSGVSLYKILDFLLGKIEINESYLMSNSIAVLLAPVHGSIVRTSLESVDILSIVRTSLESVAIIVNLLSGFIAIAPVHGSVVRTSLESVAIFCLSFAFRSNR